MCLLLLPARATTARMFIVFKDFLRWDGNVMMCSLLLARIIGRRRPCWDAPLVVNIGKWKVLRPNRHHDTTTVEARDWMDAPLDNRINTGVETGILACKQTRINNHGNRAGISTRIETGVLLACKQTCIINNHGNRARISTCIETGVLACKQTRVNNHGNRARI